MTATKEMNDRDLDALVAEQVMGLTLKHESSGYGSIAINGQGEIEKNESACRFCGSMLDASVYVSGERCAKAAPYFSHHIASAMLVVEKIAERGVRTIIERDADSEPQWIVECKKFGGGSWNFVARVEGESLPRLICEAALAALSATKEIGG